jgi:hypothetical protein
VSGGLRLLRPEADGSVRLAFSTRAGGASRGGWAGLNLGASTGDRPEHVRENRTRLCAVLGLDRERVTMGHQVHGSAVRHVDAPARPGRFTGGLSGWPPGDALVTARPGVALIVLGADCLPVLLWRRDRALVAAAHAGWRGLVDGVVAGAVAALGDPARTAAVIGPGVGPCCYPVDAALRSRFAARFGEAVVRTPAVDLVGAARVELGAAGVPASAVRAVGGCTSCGERDWFSHRRDGPASGRHAGLVWVGPA